MSDPAPTLADLRARALEVIRHLGATTWTDHNAHDPGITILEQLVYALTDLGYRAGFPVPDLLAPPPGDGTATALPTAGELLTSHPLTLLDYRKLAIDIEGVRNAWIEPASPFEPDLFRDPSEADALYLENAAHRIALAPRGVFRVALETETAGSSSEAAVIAAVHARFQAHRQVGCDFEDPVSLKKDPLTIRAEIEHAEAAEPLDILRQLLAATLDYVSPTIRFYSVREMLDRGLPPDLIFDGPRLDHGFIDSAELAAFQRREGLRTSDLTQAFMRIPGVRAVRGLAFQRGAERESWYLPISPQTTPFFDLATALRDQGVALRRGRALWTPSAAETAELLQELEIARQRRRRLSPDARDLPIPTGRYRNVGHHTSIQNHLPRTYGVGPAGLPASAPTERVAQARQLKAYLLILDQILAGAFGQLDLARRLVSFDTTEFPTYDARWPGEVPDLESVLPAELGLDELRSFAESPPQARARRSRFLNHLLARYAEAGSDFDRMPGSSTLRNAAKARFLQHYAEQSYARGLAFDTSTARPEPEKAAGLEGFLARKLGLTNAGTASLASLTAGDEGGFHLVEHLLLRPRKADRDAWLTGSQTSWRNGAFLAALAHPDPYSAQISLVLTGWTDRLNGLDPEEPPADPATRDARRLGAREQVGRLVLEMIPAHLSVHLVWIETPAEMAAFEQAWSAFRDALREAAPGGLSSPSGRDARDRIALRLGLGIPYPIRDLKLEFPAMADLDQRAEVVIRDAQAGVDYRLCDEEGNVLLDSDGKPFLLLRRTLGGGLLLTPPITEDVTFTILASREGPDHQRYETYLAARVAIKAGINDTLPVRFQPGENQVLRPDGALRIPYGTPVTLAVDLTQEGVAYQLIELSQGKSVSDPVAGNKGTILLVSPPLAEDTVLAVKASRSRDANTFAQLKTTLTVVPQPNPDIELVLSDAIVDYGDRAVLTLKSPQKSVDYFLYQAEIDPAEWITPDSRRPRPPRVDPPPTIEVPISGSTKALLLRPVPGLIHRESPGTEVAPFVGRSSSMVARSLELVEDTWLAVLARKRDSGEELELTRLCVAFARPNPQCPVSVEPTHLLAGNEARVIVEATQARVRYSLHRAESQDLLGPPGFHNAERGIEFTRLEVDFEIENTTEQRVLLPTPPLAETTVFKVLATKRLSGVSQDLAGTATVTLDTPPSPPPPAPITPVTPVTPVVPITPVTPTDPPIRGGVPAPRATRTRAPRSARPLAPEATPRSAPPAFVPSSTPKSAGVPKTTSAPETAAKPAPAAKPKLAARRTSKSKPAPKPRPKPKPTAKLKPTPTPPPTPKRKRRHLPEAPPKSTRKSVPQRSAKPKPRPQSKAARPSPSATSPRPARPRVPSPRARTKAMRRRGPKP